MTAMSYVPGRPPKSVLQALGERAIVALSSNESPLGPSPLAVRAFSECSLALHAYPDTEAIDLRERYAEICGLDVAQICAGAGTTDLIYRIVRRFGEGGSLLVPDRTFIAYACAAAEAAVPVVSAPSIEQIPEHIDASTRLVCIANPNNPTGRFLPLPALAALIDRIPRHIVVVLDEAYIEYAETGGHSALSLLEGRPNILVLRTFSKVYGLAALRVGLCVGHPGAIAVLESGRPPFSISAPAQAAAIAALGDTAHVRRSVELVREGRQSLLHALRARGLSVGDSAGNFVCVEIDRAASVWEGLLARGVVVRKLDPYGMHRHLRITVGRPDQQRLLLEALDQVLASR